jgi:LysM repeat protein
MKALACAFFLQCSIAAASEAKVVTHAVKAGETPESIAADYYGNRSLALYVTEGNRLARDVKLKPGQRLQLPTAFQYKVRRGETLEALALRFLDDRRHAWLLAAVNNLRLTDKLREGQDLVVPFQHVHRALAPESLQSISRLFYGDASKAKLLADYNFRATPILAKGERLIVPVDRVKIRAVRLQPPPKPVAGKGAPEHAPIDPQRAEQEREAELAARVGGQLAEAEKAYKEGSYSDVPAQLDRLLTREDPSEGQLAELFRLKAFAYVALGQDELAVNAFREVLARKPDVALDEATVSPKIRSALERAKKAPPP